MGVWDTTTPAGSDQIKDGDDRIRELKVAIQEALKSTDATLGDAAVFPGSAPSTTPTHAYRGHRGTTAQRTALSANVSGICFDTDKSAVYSYAGGAWNAVGYLFPATTKSLFYQSSAPTGWTRDTSANDKFIRVVSAGTPGSTGGGSIAPSSNLAHTHTTGPNYVLASGASSGDETKIVGIETTVITNDYLSTTRTFVTGLDGFVTTAVRYAVGQDTGSGGSGTFAYADVMIATKDSY